MHRSPLEIAITYPQAHDAYGWLTCQEPISGTSRQKHLTACCAFSSRYISITNSLCTLRV